MTTKPQGLDHSGAHGAEPTGSVVMFTDITEEALEPLANAAKAQVMTEAMGALVVFDGIVRNHDHGSAVRGLSYSAHPQAKEYIARVVQSVADELGGSSVGSSPRRSYRYRRVRADRACRCGPSWAGLRGLRGGG